MRVTWHGITWFVGEMALLLVTVGIAAHLAQAAGVPAAFLPFGAFLVGMFWPRRILE